jgi:hypothetical protein
MIERGDAEFQPNWLPPERYDEIAAACQQLGMDRLKPLKEALPPEIPYEEIRLVIARLRIETNRNWLNPVKGATPPCRGALRVSCSC